jgi:hypothetical protein
MKQLQFVNKAFKPISRTVKWLAGFSPKRRYRQIPADSFSHINLPGILASSNSPITV